MLGLHCLAPKENLGLFPPLGAPALRKGSEGLMFSLEREGFGYRSPRAAPSHHILSATIATG